jgi:hypothetical protein
VSVRRSTVVLGGGLVLLALHELVLAIAAHARVAHALLGAGNGPPPVGPAALAIALVVIRLAAIVLLPGAVLAALASLVAHVAERSAIRGQRSAGSERREPTADG